MAENGEYNEDDFSDVYFMRLDRGDLCSMPNDYVYKYGLGFLNLINGDPINFGQKSQNATCHPANVKTYYKCNSDNNYTFKVSSLLRMSSKNFGLRWIVKSKFTFFWTVFSDDTLTTLTTTPRSRRKTRNDRLKIKTPQTLIDAARDLLVTAADVVHPNLPPSGMPDGFGRHANVIAKHSIKTAVEVLVSVAGSDGDDLEMTDAVLGAVAGIGASTASLPWELRARLATLVHRQLIESWLATDEENRK